MEDLNKDPSASKSFREEVNCFWEATARIDKFIAILKEAKVVAEKGES